MLFSLLLLIQLQPLPRLRVEDMDAVEVESELHEGVVQTADGASYPLERALIPPEAREGDVLVIGLDTDAAQARRRFMERRMKDVWAD